MTKQLIPFLRDIVGRVVSFNSLISFIHMKPQDDGTILAMASANDGTIHFTSTSKEPIDIKDARMCLGNLMYLHQILTADFIKNKTANVLVNVKTRNEREIVSSLKFTPNNRMELNYITTDPFRASITKPLRIDEKLGWPVAFIIDGDAMKEIAGFKRIHAAAPSTGSEDVIQIVFHDGEIAIDYGEGGGIHTSTLVLDTEVIADSKTPLGVHLLSDQFLRALQQSQGPDKLIEVQLSKMAIRIHSESDVAFHGITLVRRKLRDDD